jgi:hypothetical protein
MGRGVLVACGTCLILAGIPETVAYGEQTSANANTGQTSAVQPSDYYDPCDEEEPNRNSDLCAQWKSADWAKRSFWVGLATVAGLMATLWFNLEAWRQARRGKQDTAAALKAAQDNATAATKLADTAERTARAELRAYLDFDGIHIKRWPEMDIPGSGNVAVLAVACVHNYGKTPATNLEITTTNYALINDQRQQFTVEDRIDFDSIAPTDHIRHRAYWQMPEALWSVYEQRKVKIIVSLIVTYTDVFEKPHVLRSDFETLGINDELGFIRGTRKST